MTEGRPNDEQGEEREANSATSPNCCEPGAKAISWHSKS